MRKRLKRQSQQCVARENRDRFAENFVVRRFAAAKIVVVQRRKIVVDQRIGVDEFERAAGWNGAIGFSLNIARLPGTKSDESACRRQTRCTASRDGLTRGASSGGSRRSSAGFDSGAVRLKEIGESHAEGSVTQYLKGARKRALGERL